MDNEATTIGPYTITDAYSAGCILEPVRYCHATRIEDGDVREVFLKIVHPGAGTTRTQEQAVALARRLESIRHPNLLALQSWQRCGDVVCVEFEPLRGVLLQRVFRRCVQARREQHHLLRCEDALLIASDICAALQHVAEAGLVHGQLAPLNIGLDMQGVTKIFDVGQSSGWSYFSPETIKGLVSGPPSDVFSVGTILWELCAGQHLFMSDSDFETLENIREARRRPLRTARPDAPAQLEQLCDRALRRDPADRFANAGAMAAALADLIAQVDASRTRLATLARA